MNAKSAAIAAGAFAVVLLGVYLYRRGFGGVAQDSAAAATETIIGAGQGVALGVSRSVGIPDLDAKKCQDALAAGDYWNASFFCPAGTFVTESASAIAGKFTGLFGDASSGTIAQTPETIEGPAAY